MVFIAINVLVPFIIMTVLQVTLSLEERKDVYFMIDQVTAYSSYVEFCMLTACVLFLINRLTKVRDNVLESWQDEERNVYNSEIRTLLVIMGVFDISYLLRGVWN